MFKEILKVIPRIESRDLNSMERTLNTRFARVAKKFGGGLMSAIKGGGVLGIATVLIDKLLNPLQEISEVIDKTLNRGDDLSTFAKQFNTTAGALARLQAFGKATGLEPEGVRLLMGKFQASVAQAAADPSKPSAVSAYVGRDDTAEAFFEFIQAMQKLPTDIEKNLVQQEVFGEKQILKASEFLNANFKDLNMQIGGPSAEALTNAAEYIASQSDKRDLNRAKRELTDLPKKAQLINDTGIVDMLDLRERIDLKNENTRVGASNDLAKIAIASDKMVKLLEDGYLKLAPALAVALPALMNEIASGVKLIEKSRTLRGLLPGAGKDK